MRQIGAENEDPLKRIQEEINEVARRENELRNQLNKRSKDSNDDFMSSTNSDDSGFSTSPSPINGCSSAEDQQQQQLQDNKSQEPEPIKSTKQSVFIPTRTGFNVPRQIIATQKILVRTMSTPQIFTPSPPARRFNNAPVQKGIMQKFIASRGRLGNTNNRTSNINEKINTSTPIEIKNRGQFFMAPAEIISPPQIERDNEGKPIRRGFIPVEEKIQKELREMKNREIELKRLRRTQQQSNPDLMEYNDEDYESEEEEDYESYPPPGKLRATKSIGELYDAMTNVSLSPRDSPSPPQFGGGHHHGLRPALSLAQLCDLEPESVNQNSQCLIKQWENMIHKRQEIV